MPLEARRLTPADYRVMPWKNGQGTTTEIATFPPGATLDTFTWRVSLADIAASGPFSAFPGVDRLLLQTAGPPMTLVHEVAPSGAAPTRRPLTLLSPVRFPGELPTHGEVPTPPVRDFNIMTRRARAHASVTVHELAAGSLVCTQGPAIARLVYALQGSLSLRSLAVASTSVSAPETTLLAPGDTWLLTGAPDDDTGFELSATSAAIAVAVTFSAVVVSA